MDTTSNATIIKYERLESDNMILSKLAATV